ncbi:cation diffusion facilitator family transporter [Clostridium sp. C2-6-12]|uniref:cation diffusion facilitator family transporter n=1 Tax=Clostridium sp. C2-6-12 TaxID=2698832 RepID=UPI00136C91AD|nr:cation diffusion facilitator family transporter [Clostridium sp. C2-6-12]
MNEYQSKREKQIMKTSGIGIGTNVLLAIFKAIIGLASNSVAIILDAINNISDALSSILTIVGTKLAAKPADKKHPYGYGRMEYITSIVVAAIVLAAGISSFISSGERIFKPEEVSYSKVTVVIILVGIASKYLLGRYVKKVGNEVNSKALIASGADASFDALISTATLISVLISIIFNVTIDGYVGVIISIVIIKAGIEMIMDSLDEILGKRPSSTLTKAIKEDVMSYEGVKGAYDLLLNNYGPVKMTGSIHIEVDENATGKQIFVLTKRIQSAIMKKYDTFLTIGIYIVNSDDETSEMSENIRKIVMSYEYLLEIHALYIVQERKLVTFDVVIDLAADNPEKIRSNIEKELKGKYEDFTFMITYDTDYSD